MQKSFCMPRARLIRTPLPYHIYNRSNNREYFYLDLPSLWEVFLDCLRESATKYECNVHSFVMMANHYHLVVSTPELNIDETIQHFQTEVARKANQRAERINHFFGGRYKWTVVGGEEHYWSAVKYVYRNPVKAGICAKVEAYPYSSLNKAALKWKHYSPYGNFPSEAAARNWFNQPFAGEQESQIQKALRRREFKLPRNKAGFLTRLDAPLR
jgi:putative transposase